MNAFQTLILLVFCASLLGAQVSSGQSPADTIKQSRQLSREGKQNEAIALYRAVLLQHPDSFELHLAAGTALDLQGQYDEARKNIANAIELAPNANAKVQAQRSMAVSYAFEHKANDAAKYEQEAFDAQLAAKDYYAAGEAADELARIYIESGDLDNAYKWYKTGYETGLKQPDITESRKNVWGFRWENAQARIAARRGNRQEAHKHIDAAKQYLEKSGDPQQESFLPALTGYVALYEGDYKAAIADLQKANQRDPFVLSLLAQAYEKSGDKMQAQEYYHKVLAFDMHNPANAFARPIAKQALGE